MHDLLSDSLKSPARAFKKLFFEMPLPRTGSVGVLLLAVLSISSSSLSGELGPLNNDAYIIHPQPDGSLHIAHRDGSGFDVFGAEFIAIFCREKPTTSRLKWDQPVYNLPAWKLSDGTIQADLFKIGEVISLKTPAVSREDATIIWTFDNEKLTLKAKVWLPIGEAEPRIDYEVVIKQTGYYTFGYSGAPALSLENVTRLWQPQVWDGRRLPPHSFLIGDDHCSIPGCLVERSALPSQHPKDPMETPTADRRSSYEAGFRTVGVMADPWQFPYEMPNGRNRRFGVTVRNSNGLAQPMVFSPFIGSGTRFRSGEQHRFSVLLLSQPQTLSDSFERVARNICGFRDQRENTLTTLNQTLGNMVEFSLSKWAKFDTANKSSHYPDAKGTVKNVSCLHPLGIAMVMDEPRLFHQQAVPIMEYLLSREKFLFAISEAGLSHSQRPSMNMNGPAMPVSELAALDRISGGGNSLFLKEARRLYSVDRRLNMNWVTRGASWQRSLWLYRITRNRNWLEDASIKADRYIKDRIDTQPTDFAEAGDGTFFEYMTPWWKDLYELYRDTRDPDHLAAAHIGARRYAQFVWFYPSVPDRPITVNPRGLAPRRGRPDDDGLYRVPQETVPAWRVSDQGLVCEGNGTVQRLGILIATHAPYFLRIAQDTGDAFLRDIARNAIVGRYANFPGYHLNTRFSTAQEKPDFILHPYEELKPTTSIHYNHILPHTNLLIDYLYSRCYDLSEKAIDFPAEYAEGYAYLQGRIYGSGSGRFYDHPNVRPWMPSGIIHTSHTEINYISARDTGGDGFFLALMNTSDRAIGKLNCELDPTSFHELPSSLEATLWIDNQRQEKPLAVSAGRFTVPIRSKGITALRIHGLRPKVQFQDQISNTAKIELFNLGESTVAGCQIEASVLSFGPELRWFYAWLRSDRGKPNLAALELTLTFDDAVTTKHSDSTFPHEFHVAIPADVKEIGFQISGSTP